MEIFFASEVSGGAVILGPEESVHCVKVLRHRVGDTINVVDGMGTMMVCRMTDDSLKAAQAKILETVQGWGGHPYSLTMAVCPTKNNDRFEWFVEKAVELGVDEIVPVIGERSERRVFKTERARKIAMAAMKQSLKAQLPLIAEPMPVKELISSSIEAGSAAPSGSLPLCGPSRVNGRREGLPQPAPTYHHLKLICYCFEGETERQSIKDVLKDAPEGSHITIMIGPEGDFSPEEAARAIEKGFIPVHLGPSRLRTETAAVTAAAAVYFHYVY